MVLTDTTGFSACAFCLAPNKNLVRGACLADVALNFGLGFIPGINALKLWLDLGGANLHPFQRRIDRSSLVSAGPGGLSILSGLADIGRSVALSLAQVVMYGKGGPTPVPLTKQTCGRHCVIRNSILYAPDW
jgi:hypothetical protein